MTPASLPPADRHPANQPKPSDKSPQANETPSGAAVRRLPYMAYEDQQQITRLCVRCGLLLMQYGTESVTVVNLCRRLGLALGASEVECSIAFNGITITTIYNNRCITTLRASTTHVINVNIIIQIQRIILDLEQLPSTNLLSYAAARFDDLDRRTYPAWLTNLLAASSCACFAYLAGGDWEVCGVTYVASAVGFWVRAFLVKHFFSLFVATLASAFAASLLSGLSLWARLGNDPHIAIASSVVFLIPSFPLINSLSDILKGYMNIGIGRFMFVVVLTLSTCIGIVSALLLLGINRWGFSN